MVIFIKRGTISEGFLSMLRDFGMKPVERFIVIEVDDISDVEVVHI